MERERQRRRRSAWVKGAVGITGTAVRCGDAVAHADGKSVQGQRQHGTAAGDRLSPEHASDGIGESDGTRVGLGTIPPWTGDIGGQNELRRPPNWCARTHRGQGGVVIDDLAQRSTGY